MEKIPDIIHESWHPLIGHLFQHESMKQLKYEILKTNNFYPERNNIFKCFRMRVENIRVVILGQDPYSNKGRATGLAFAVNEDYPLPPSLRVIAEDNQIAITDKSLEHWERQGVFLLNTALTVAKGDPGSHIKYWAYFTKNVIRALSSYHPAIYLLWGEKAKLFEQHIHNNRIFKYKEQVHGEIFHRKNIILEAGHPAAEIYTDSKGLFYGVQHFRKVNNIFVNSDLPTINF